MKFYVLFYVFSISLFKYNAHCSKTNIISETPAREHNIDAKPPVLPLETFFSSESSVKISTSDVHMVPHEKQLATHERREKRGLFENLPAAKIHKSDSIFHTTIHPVRESISDSGKGFSNIIS